MRVIAGYLTLLVSFQIKMDEKNPVASYGTICPMSQSREQATTRSSAGQRLQGMLVHLCARHSGSAPPAEGQAGHNLQFCLCEISKLLPRTRTLNCSQPWSIIRPISRYSFAMDFCRKKSASDRREQDTQRRVTLRKG